MGSNKMGNRLTRNGLPAMRACRAVKAKFKTKDTKLIRIFLSIMVLVLFVSGSGALAFETTTASALKIEKSRGNDSPSSSNMTSRNNSGSQADPCRSLLSASSPDAIDKIQEIRNYHRPVSGLAASGAGNTATPVALGLVVGVRVALGSDKIVRKSQRVQFGPEVRMVQKGGASHALAIAAYRACKNEHTLSLQQQK